VNSRNGYRRREWDTRAGTVELAVPKLRQGSYYPEWLLERRRRAERALATVVATSYLLGVSTRRVEKLAGSLGVTKLSKSQVSVMAAELDEMVASFRSRPLDGGPYTFVWIDALTQKVREGGRTVNVHALIATGVNADGNGRSWAWMSPPPRTARGGWRSCAAWPPAACPACRLCGCTEPGRDQERAELVAVQAYRVGLVVQPWPPHVGGGRMVEEIFLDGIAVEPRYRAQAAGDGGPGPPRASRSRAKNSISARRPWKRRSWCCWHQLANCRKSSS
jgi:Transposase, Mutator family